MSENHSTVMQAANECLKVVSESNWTKYVKIQSFLEFVDFSTPANFKTHVKMCYINSVDNTSIHIKDLQNPTPSP